MASVVGEFPLPGLRHLLRCCLNVPSCGKHWQRRMGLVQLLVRFLILDFVVGVSGSVRRSSLSSYGKLDMVDLLVCSVLNSLSEFPVCLSAGTLLSSCLYCSILVSFASFRRSISRHMYANKGGDGVLP